MRTVDVVPFVSGISAPVLSGVDNNGAFGVENIRFPSVSDPASEGMSVVVGPDGYLNAVQDVGVSETVWSDSKSTNLDVGGSPVKLLGVTVDQAFPAAEGSFQLAMYLDNNTGAPSIVTIIFVKNGSYVRTSNVNVGGSEKDKFVLWSGGLGSDVAVGDEFSVEIYANGGSIVVDAGRAPYTLKVIRRESAAVRVFEFSGTLGTVCTISDIESAVPVCERYGSFFVSDGVKVFRVVRCVLGYLSSEVVLCE